MLSSISLSVLVATLVMMEYGLFNSSFDPYWVFSAGGTAALAGMLVVHQGKVSNTVLWTAALEFLYYFSCLSLSMVRSKMV